MNTPVLNYQFLGVSTVSITLFTSMIFLRTQDLTFSLGIAGLLAIIMIVINHTSNKPSLKQDLATQTPGKTQDQPGIRNEKTACSACNSPLELGIVRCPSCGHRNVKELNPDQVQQYLNKARVIKKKYD